MQVQPYLFFDGRCEEAITFYRSSLGAEVTMLMRFKDSPESTPPGMVPPGTEDTIMNLDRGTFLLKIGSEPPLLVQHTRSAEEVRLTETDAALTGRQPS